MSGRRRAGTEEERGTAESRTPGTLPLRADASRQTGRGPAVTTRLGSRDAEHCQVGTVEGVRPPKQRVTGAKDHGRRREHSEQTARDRLAELMDETPAIHSTWTRGPPGRERLAFDIVLYNVVSLVGVKISLYKPMEKVILYFDPLRSSFKQLGLVISYPFIGWVGPFGGFYT